MKPGRYPIQLHEGVGYTRRMTWRSAGLVVPLAGYTGRLEVRHPSMLGEIALLLTNGVEGGITLADAEPNIIIEFTEAQTSLGFSKSSYRLVLIPPVGQSFVLLSDEITLEQW